MKISFSKRNGFVSVLLVLFACLFLFQQGCSQKAIKSLNEMTPKEKASWMMSIYNAQYNDYLSIVNSHRSFTKEQARILQKKKELLVKVYPLIKAYVSYVDSGVIPSEDLEQQILLVVDELIKLGFD